MSAMNSSQNTSSNYRTSYLHSKNKFYKKGKSFQNSNKKHYQEEEKEISPLKSISKFGNQQYNQEYEDEYQGLTYNQKSKIQNWDNNSYYYEEYNNFKTKWKTEMCRYWEMNGVCKYGDNCAFAHGDSELKKRKLTYNYKTKPCKQFFELGYCTYGCRCQFSHKKEDYKKEKKENGDTSDNEISYLKIIKEFLSDENQISHELVKRPRLMTFERIAKSTLEESQNSKLQLYEDIINIKNRKNNLIFKFSEDFSNYTNVSSDNNNDN